jgi:hypothetical protein
MAIDVLRESFSCLLLAQDVPFSHFFPVSEVSSLLEDPHRHVEVLPMGAVVFHLLFVLIVLNVRDVGVNKERIFSTVAFKEELLLFLQIDWLEFFEACREVSFLLFFVCIFAFLNFGLLFNFNFFLTFFFLFRLLLDSLLDGS